MEQAHQQAHELYMYDIIIDTTSTGLIVNETHQQFNDAYMSSREHILSGKTFKHLEKIQNV